MAVPKASAVMTTDVYVATFLFIQRNWILEFISGDEQYNHCGANLHWFCLTSWSHEDPNFVSVVPAVLLDFVVAARLLTKVIPWTTLDLPKGAHWGPRHGRTDGNHYGDVVFLWREFGWALFGMWTNICPTWICSGFRIRSECIKICISWQRLPFNSIIA